MTPCFHCWISCSFFGLLMSLASCSASMCVGRRSGYPFSGPRSRPNGSARKHQLINAVVGPPTLWQARMGPAPGHPNHLPGSGFGAAGIAEALISVGGGVCGRRPHSRWPTRRPAKYGVHAVKSKSQRWKTASVGRRTRTTPSASASTSSPSSRPPPASARSSRSIPHGC